MKKKNLWNSLPCLFLMIHAGLFLREQFSIPGLVITALALAGMAAALILGGTGAALVSTVYGAVVLELILPALPVSLEQLGKGLIGMLSPVSFIRSSPIALIYLAGYAITLVLTYRVHKTMLGFPVWLAVLRIAAQTLLLLSYAKGVLGDGALFAEGIVLAGMIALYWDVRQCREYEPVHGWWNAAAVTMLLIAAVSLFGCDAEGIAGWFRLEERWLPVFLTALALGGLLLANDLRERRRLVDSECWYPLVWAAVVLIMMVWPGFRSQWGLYLLFPLTALVIRELIEWINPYRFIGRSRTIVKWLMIAATVLLQIKAERMGRFVAIMVLVLEAGGWAVARHCARSSTTAARERMQSCGLGIAAVLLSFTLRIGTPAQLVQEPGLVLAAALCCFVWYLLCRMEQMLSLSDTSMYPREFDPLKRMLRIAPILLLTASMLRIVLYK